MSNDSNLPQAGSECFDKEHFMKVAGNDPIARNDLIEIFTLNAQETLDMLRKFSEEDNGHSWDAAIQDLFHLASQMGAKNIQDLCTMAPHEIVSTASDKDKILHDIEEELERLLHYAKNL